MVIRGVARLGEFIAIDWGSSRRRRFHVDGQGVLVERRVDDRGALTFATGELDAEMAALLAEAARIPVLLSGMIGSDRGWRVAPYVACPADAAAIARALLRPAPGVAIVPGLSTETAERCDVMRGEEVQIVGALASGELSSGSLCLPGTHSKWVRVEGNHVTDFRTTMTGELFSHLTKAGVLSAMIAASDATLDAPFRDGVAHALANDDLGAELFHIRARVLLGRVDPATVAPFVSGLLIGEELRINLAGTTGKITLIGEAALLRRYAEALRVAGRTSISIDGEAAFVAGARAIAERAF